MAIPGAGDLTNSIGRFFGDPAAALKKKKPATRKDKSDKNSIKGYQRAQENIYRVNFNNWYRSLPYGFRFFDRKGKSATFFLPINPSNITVSTHMATNVVTTLYGVVEEHSEVRFHDITISGTTGMTPTFSRPPGGSTNVGAFNSGRESFPVFKSVAQGFGARTEGALRRALGSVEDLTNFKSGKKNKSGISDIKETGYYAFHNLFRFFLLYKKDASGEATSAGGRPQTNQRPQHPLVFLNYKDGIQYNVAITKFDLTKDASDPMLYKYKIIMRGYQLGALDKQKYESRNLQEQLGLGEVTSLSIFSAMKDLSKNAKNVLGGLQSAFNGAGS